MPKIADDPRIDPRIKNVMAVLDGAMPAQTDVASRDELLAEVNTEEALAQRQMLTAFMNMCDTDEVAPSKGLAQTEYSVKSEPDGNMINVRFIRPEGTETLPAVYYIHGGGMQALSTSGSNGSADPKTDDRIGPGTALR